MILYVEDMAVAAATTSAVDGIIEEIGKLFVVKHLGALKQFLGLEFLGYQVVRDRLNQRIDVRQHDYSEWTITKILPGVLTG